MDTPIKKTLPHAVTKAQLVKLYLDQYSEKVIISAVNLIIIDNRKNKPIYKGYTTARLARTNTITHQEFVEFIATYGDPKGFEVTSVDRP
jgi:hypothetical protein